MTTIQDNINAKILRRKKSMVDCRLSTKYAYEKTTIRNSQEYAIYCKTNDMSENDFWKYCNSITSKDVILFKALNRKKNYMIKEIKKTYFYVQDIILNSHQYKTYYDNNNVDIEEFWKYCNSVLQDFIDDNEEFYNWHIQFSHKNCIHIDTNIQCAIDMKLFHFCQREEKTMQILENSAKIRKYIHNVCDLLNILHVSIDKNKDRYVTLAKTCETSLIHLGNVKLDPKKLEYDYNCNNCLFWKLIMISLL